MATDNNLSNNTIKVITLINLGEEINKNLDEDVKTNRCVGSYQIVNIPYTYDTNIIFEHELQTFASEWITDDLEDARVGDIQYIIDMLI